MGIGSISEGALPGVYTELILDVPQLPEVGPCSIGKHNRTQCVRWSWIEIHRHHLCSTNLLHMVRPGLLWKLGLPKSGRRGIATGQSGGHKCPEHLLTLFAVVPAHCPSWTLSGRLSLPSLHGFLCCRKRPNMAPEGYGGGGQSVGAGPLPEQLLAPSLPHWWGPNMQDKQHYHLCRRCWGTTSEGSTG